MDFGESFGGFSMVGANEVESREAEKLEFREIAPESSGKSQLTICSYDLSMFRGSLRRSKGNQANGKRSN